jgi:hypothetical protein
MLVREERQDTTVVDDWVEATAANPLIRQSLDGAAAGQRAFGSACLFF